MLRSLITLLIIAQTSSKYEAIIEKQEKDMKRTEKNQNAYAELRNIYLFQLNQRF